LAVAPANQKVPTLPVRIGRDGDEASFSCSDILAESLKLRWRLRSGRRKGRGGEKEGGGVEVHFGDVVGGSVPN